MAVFKCKMCGGNLEAAEGQNIGTCDSCGSTMTLPKANDERIVNLFNRATHYRQQNEFDKAIATYESILEEDSENAEAYWGLVLSKYGIEYVKDPKTHKRIPTCHRLQHTSILADLDYQSALKYAIDYDAEKLYKNEAETISEIQKNILSVANSEEAYDIFICYKETDNSGKRTMDSVLAQDIYSQLANEGYKVFFSRITLEDKLGQEYEPYIFSALNSAKVMLVVGTDKDNFNAVWVKNEWSRFLALSRKDKNKVIIPCYKDMDAYDLPDELSMFQSQDMNKIGFLQDLIRGIKKVMQNENKQTARNTDHTKDNFQTEPLLKRAFLLLEEAEWQKANDLLEQVLNYSPENAQAYLGKLMIELKLNKKDDLGKITDNLSIYPNFQKAVQFADDKLKSELKQYKSLSMDLLKNEEEKILKQLKTEYKKVTAVNLKYKKRLHRLISVCIGGLAILILSFFIMIGSPDIGAFLAIIALGGTLIGVIVISISAAFCKYDTHIIKRLICDVYIIKSKLSNVILSDRQKQAITIIKNDQSVFIPYYSLINKDKTLKISIFTNLLQRIGLSLDEAKQITENKALDINAIILQIDKESNIILLSHTCSKCGYTFKVKYNKPEEQNKIPMLSTICPKCKSKEFIKEKNL